MKTLRRLVELAACYCLTMMGIILEAQAQDSKPTFPKVDSIEARVQGCVTCHGTHGQGTTNDYFPRIAGKPAGYLFNQLVAFRDGKRHYPPMNYLVAYLPDPYLREIAEYFAGQRPPVTQHKLPSVAQPVMELGQVLATNGDPRRGIPACIACHGNTLTGMNPGIPGLVGLRPAYIAAQLTRWKVGDRHATDPDCMKRVAQRLNEDDISAVSAWLGRQDIPLDSAPEKSNVNRMPFACGSQR